MFYRLFKRSRQPFRLFIEGCKTLVEVRAGATILQAALDAGIRFPHRCRAGACGTCKCRLIEGNVKELTDKSYLLSREELQAHYILACQSIPTSDVRVAVGRLISSVDALVEAAPQTK